MIPRSVDDQLSELIDILSSDRLRVRQFTSKDRRYTDFVGFDIVIGGDHRPSCVIDSLALSGLSALLFNLICLWSHHHVFPKQSLLLLQELFDTLRWEFALTHDRRIL